MWKRTISINICRTNFIMNYPQCVLTSLCCMRLLLLSSGFNCVFICLVRTHFVTPSNFISFNFIDQELILVVGFFVCLISYRLCVYTVGIINEYIDSRTLRINELDHGLPIDQYERERKKTFCKTSTQHMSPTTPNARWTACGCIWIAE